MKQLLIFLFFVIVINAQPVHPLQPSFLSITTAGQYNKTKQVKRGFHLQLSGELGARYSPFPPKLGAAPYVALIGETRYSFGKVPTKGLGVSGFASTEWMLNPITYKGELYSLDPLFSLMTGLQLFWRFETSKRFDLEPYGGGQCRFYNSPQFDTGFRPFLSLDMGIRFAFSRHSFVK